MTLATAAVAYAERGWFIFPLQFKSKEPMPGTHGFKDAARDPVQVARWWSSMPSANIGLWPGPSELAAFDVDGAEGEATAQRCGLLSEPTLMVISGRVDGGRHLYFSVPPGQYLEPTTLGPGTSVRHWKGYVVLPPSIHPTGQQYRWAGRIGDLRSLPSLTLPQAAPVPAASPSRLHLIPTDPETRERRVIAYLASVGSRGEGDRNSTAFVVACWLRRDMALPERDAWEWCVAWNERNRPPLSERELGAVFRSAAKHGRRPLGAADPQWATR